MKHIVNKKLVQSIFLINNSAANRDTLFIYFIVIIHKRYKIVYMNILFLPVFMCVYILSYFVNKLEIWWLYLSPIDIKYHCYSNNIIRNINKVTIQIDNNSTVNDMLFRELILLFHHA